MQMDWVIGELVDRMEARLGELGELWRGRKGGKERSEWDRGWSLYSNVAAILVAF